tara:strand:+ start:940 stop:1122 length:183 start_codon:yes stop_codon:yes gene_type:complete
MKKGKMFEMTLFNKIDFMFGAKFYSSEWDAILIGFKLREGIYIGAFGVAIELNWKLHKSL